MKRVFLILISMTVIFCISACSYDTKTRQENRSQHEYNIKADEQIEIEGIIKNSNLTSPQYCLKLDNPITVYISNQFDTEEYVCSELYFYDESELNGNYDFKSVLNQRCIVSSKVENFRGVGQLFLLEPKIKCEGKEIQQKQYETVPDWYTKKIYVCNETSKNFYIKNAENDSAELYIGWKHIGTIYLNETTSGNDDTGYFYRYICHINDSTDIKFLYYSSTDRIIVYDENYCLSGVYDYVRTMD